MCILASSHPQGFIWGEPTCTLVPWRQGFRHPTRNECMGLFAQIQGFSKEEFNFAKYTLYIHMLTHVHPQSSRVDAPINDHVRGFC